MSTKTSTTIAPYWVVAAKWCAALVFATALIVGWMTSENGWTMVATNTLLAAAIIFSFIATALVATKCIQRQINRSAKRYADIAEHMSEVAVEDLILSVNNAHTAMKKSLAKTEMRLMEELQHTRQTHYATIAEAQTRLKSV